ncbi:hypothetical protein NQD34_012489 [Periophthalmus magnuspinnatus]|nr:hypothetical protein NQD34_012489 [Periophthalmus magnuspinnatus]
MLESSVVLRVTQMPLIQSALQSLTSAYSQVKGRHPLLQIMGGVAEVGVVSVSQVALKQATPLLTSLQPQIRAVSSLALLGLDRLEQNFPILQQSTDQVSSHLRDALAITLDDLQLWVVEGVDVALEGVERGAELVSERGRALLRALQGSKVGQAAFSGLDDLLTRLEEVTAFYLPLPPTLRLQWEQRVQQFEEEDEDEPSVWTRVRSLVLILVLQIYHRLLKTRDQLRRSLSRLQSTADAIGLSPVLDLVGDLLHSLQSLVVALLYRAEDLREGALVEIRNRALVLVQFGPVQRVLELPEQIQNLVRDLQELSKLLLQLLINATPLYNLIQQPSEQEVEDFLNQHDFTSNSSSRRSSANTNANSLFLKAMDGRPRRRRSLYSLSARGTQSPEPRRQSDEQEVPPTALEVPAPRRPSATDLLLAPLRQFVSQSQKAFEYLSPNADESMHGEEEEESD